MKPSRGGQDLSKELIADGGEAAFDADAFFLWGVGSLEHVKGKVSKGCKVGWSVLATDTAVILTEDDVENIMKATFDAPMLTGVLGEFIGVCCQRRDVIARLTSRRTVGSLDGGFDHGDTGEVEPTFTAVRLVGFQ